MRRALILLSLTKNAFFACFGAYVRQPHGHIGWAKSMPFASFNPTNPRTNPWNFGGICSAFDEVEKLSFFESAILNFFSKKNKFFFASSPWKLVTNYMLEWMGLNFYYYDGLQPKIRAGIINEHECTRELPEINKNCEYIIFWVVLKNIFSINGFWQDSRGIKWANVLNNDFWQKIWNM